MATATLKATPRSDVGKGAARKLRSTQRTPAVIYGHNRDPQLLAVETRELEKLLEHIAAGSTVVELSLDGTTMRTLIREIQRHPYRHEILHVDFMELVAGEKVTLAVPIVLVGTPDGVRVDGGILDQVMREIEVKVDPANIPNHIDVDVEALGLNDSIHVSDLTLPPGVEVLADADATVCVVSPPRVVEEVAAPAPEAAEEEAAEPELIRKPKGEEAEEGEE
jgi:large subunit ribosomal protein L25